MLNLKESKRLEAAWGGDFGNNYIKRNKKWRNRIPFWKMVSSETKADSILEVGCSVGHNLKALSTGSLYGIDINHRAIELARKRLPDGVLMYGSAKLLPWKDKNFDLVFTMGVLIHQPEESLHLVMSEIVRCSRQWVLCAEYAAQKTTPVEYRGLEASLFKRDYKDLYLKAFQLVLYKEGFLGKKDGFDDLTWQLFRKV